jgi:hypothetical protein
LQPTLASRQSTEPASLFAEDYEIDADRETIWIIGTHREIMVDEGLDNVYAAFGKDDPERYEHYVLATSQSVPWRKLFPVKCAASASDVLLTFGGFHAKQSD